MSIDRRVAARSDDGVALVAAMSVALIGIAVASLVITQTIMAVNDSGRDRLRTTEVHAAEAALDATMAELEDSSPCGAPSFSPITLAEGAQATIVTVAIEYYNDDSVDPIPCSGGVLTALPSRATVTSTAVGVNDSVGLNPERSLQADLALKPRVSLSEDAAIFSAMDVFVGAGFTLSPQLLEQQADIWVDGGSWDCAGGAKINGSLIVPAGGVNFSNSACHVGGDLWSQNGLTFPETAAAEYSVDGNVTVRSGNLTASNPIFIGGDVTVGGSKAGHPVIANGNSSYNVGAASITNIEPVGLPVIDYTLSDWTGFERRTRSELAARVFSQYPVPTWHRSIFENCKYAGSYTGVNGPVVLPADETLYDLRDCASGFQSESGFEFELNADTVFFVRSFKTSNNFTFSSGDGGAHKLWVIVPYSSGSGSIVNSTPMTVEPPLESFWYTRGAINIHNNSSFIGQVYGGDVDIHTPATFTYTNVGVPGVDLVSAAESASGFEVELLFKREVS